MLSKLFVSLNGLALSMQREPLGHRKPLPSAGPGGIPGAGMYPSGLFLSVIFSKCPPQNWSVLVKFAILSGSCHTQFLRRLDLKLCTPTIENRSQKKPIKNATLTSKGAAFFKLRRMTLKRVNFIHSLYIMETYRSTTGEIQETNYA